MPNDGSMDAYAAARASEAPPMAEAPIASPAAPTETPAQDPANSGPAETVATPDAASPSEPGAAPVPETPQQVARRQSRNRAQERFNELTRSNAEKDRQIALLIENQRMALARSQSPEQPTSPQRAQQQNQPTDPQPSEDQFPGDYRAYLDARSAWVARQEYRQEAQRDRTEREQQERERTEHAQQQESMQQIGRVVDDFAGRNDEVRAKFSDYDAVTESLDDHPIGPHNRAMVETILLRRDSGHVLYHLGKNPQVVAHISRLPLALQGAAVGEFAASLRHAPQPSPAPTPGRPVGNRSPAGPATIPVAGSMDDYAATRARMRKE